MTPRRLEQPIISSSEDGRREEDVRRFELLHEFRSNSGWLHSADDLAVLNARLFKHKYVLKDDHVALHALNFGHRDDASGTVLHARLLNDQIHSRRDLLANCANREIHAGHQTHGLKTRQGITRRIRVGSGHRSIVTSVHRLKHVERFSRTALTNHDPIWPHTKGVHDKITNGDFAASFDIGWPRFQGHDVILAQLKLRGVLDRDDALPGYLQTLHGLMAQWSESFTSEHLNVWLKEYELGGAAASFDAQKYISDLTSQGATLIGDFLRIAAVARLCADQCRFAHRHHARGGVLYAARLGSHRRDHR